MTQTARARNLVPADRQTADPGCWERLRTGEKTRSIQAKARLAAYAAHPSTSRRSTSSGFVMLTAGEQAEVDADHTREEPGLGVEEDQPPAGSDCPQVRRKGAPRPQQTGYIREERLTSGQALFVVSHLYARTSSPNWGRVFPNSGKTPWWSDLDGLRTTVPHVLHAYGAVSVIDFKQRAGERRRFIVESPARRTLFDAIAALTADNPGAAYSPAQIRTALAALGCSWSTWTVKDLLEDEASATAGRLQRVRRGLFRLRGQDQKDPAVTTRALAPVRDHVLAALRELTAEGRKRVTSPEVAERLAVSGVCYSQRAVRQGLLQLRQATPPFVAIGPDQRYWLMAGCL